MQECGGFWLAVTGSQSAIHVSPGFTGERQRLRRGRNGGLQGTGIHAHNVVAGENLGSMGKREIFVPTNVFDTIVSLSDSSWIFLLLVTTTLTFTLLKYLDRAVISRIVLMRVYRDESASIRQPGEGRLSRRAGRLCRPVPRKHGIHRFRWLTKPPGLRHCSVHTVLLYSYSLIVWPR